MSKIKFKVPRSRLFQAKPEFSAINEQGQLVQARDVILHLSFGRIAATDNNTYELQAEYNPVQNCLEIDIPDHVLEFVTDIEIGPNFRCFMDWLTGLKDPDGTGGAPVGSGATGATGPAGATGATGTGGGGGGATGATGATGTIVGPATFRSSFTIADWAAGTDNEITIVRTGVSGVGEIGPHNLPLDDIYLIQVIRDLTDEIVDVGIEVNPTTGDVTLTKTGLGADFDGRVIVVASAGTGPAGPTGPTGTGPTGPTGPAGVRTFAFVASDWSDGTNDEITVPKGGPILAGEIGPHGLASDGPYIVQVFKTDPNNTNLLEEVSVGLIVDRSDGTIILRKGGVLANFDGSVLISEPL